MAQLMRLPAEAVKATEAALKVRPTVSYFS